MPSSFAARLRRIQQDKDSAVCVGLDPDPERFPTPLQGRSALDATLQFCRAVVDATADVACAFKLNFAFFEALGPVGLQVLSETAARIPDHCLTIADAKRGDIGNSARFYAQSVFDDMGFDACTVAPYMGRDAVRPFLQRPGTAAFVLARTSNPGAADLQEACTCANEDGRRTPLYLHTARKVADWASDAPATGGLVVGATAPEALTELRTACPALPFLVPGVGAQGGDPGAVMSAAATDRGLVLVNSSRSILYASPDDDYADAAHDAAAALQNALRG